MERSSAVVKAPCTLLTDVPSPGRHKWKTPIGDYDWVKTPIAGLAAVLMLLIGGYRDELRFGIDSMWGEKRFSWKIVDIIMVYEFNPKMTTTSQCRYSWLELLYSRVNVERWADALMVAMILTVLSLIFGNFGLKKMIRRKRKEESVNPGELSSVASAEETSISRNPVNFHRESEVVHDKTKENVHCESKVEDEKAKESKVQEEKTEEYFLQESKAEDEKTEEESKAEDEKTEEESKAEDEKTEEEAANESQLIAFHNLFNAWKHSEALNVLEKIQPTNVMIEIWKARCLVKMERPKWAKKLLLEQLEKDKENGEFLLELGYIFLLKENYKESQDCFEKVLALSTEGNSSWEMAVTGLMSIENSKKKTHFKWEYHALMILALANALVETKWLYYCGMACVNIGYFNNAKMFFDEVMLRGGFRLAWIRRAFCCVATGDFEDALQCFQRLVPEVKSYQKVVDLLKRISTFVEGECPYKVLSISEKDRNEETKKAFARLFTSASSSHEKMKMRRAFARLSDYTFKLQYDGLRREIFKYTPN